MLCLGSTVAEYTGNVLHHKVRSSPYFDKKEYRLALKDAFLTIDQDLKEGNRRAKNKRVGWVGNVVFCRPQLCL